ncbi:MAG: VOC family protein [Verrucomicrobiae bacterium]|nr:VOC family protein [Verrucomicrobiae bacterium]
MSNEETTETHEHQIPGTISWNELHSQDPESAKSFYSQLFDWEMEEMSIPTGTYTMFRRGNVPVAGLVKPSISRIDKPAWMHYVTVAKLEDAIEKTQNLGGSVVMEPTSLPQGRFAVIGDPQGAHVGLYEFGEKPEAY